MATSGEADRVGQIRERLAAIESERQELTDELVQLKHRDRDGPVPTRSHLAGARAPLVTKHSPPTDKIALFRRLFAGRCDVFPMRWENAVTGKSGYSPACANEWKSGICQKPRVKCSACPHQAFIPVSDEIIRGHLGGARTNAPVADVVAGVYPLLPDNTCHFLAVDFDGERWAPDAIAFVQTCDALNLAVALERSRSGTGGHAWMFFAEPVPARLARQLASVVLTETMDRRPEIGFTSYDRFFPSQDVMPAGGFGNLIALPLQSRARKRGNTLFVDTALQPLEDQWAFLSALAPIPRALAEAMVADAVSSGRVVGVRMPVEDENAEQPWLATPSRRSADPPIVGTLPRFTTVVLADGVYIDRSDLPPAMVAHLVRLAAFENPEFFRAQAMRLPTHGKPHIISCAELHPRHIALPRGCLDEALEVLTSCGIAPHLDDRRENGASLDMRFVGVLRAEQALAASALSHHDSGVLAAATAFGKTIVAASLIASRGRNTLVLVHRRELLAQWVERLASFLSIDRSDIGVIGGGQRKPTRKIDVAVIQSLVRRGVVSDDLAGYGHLVVDECHHLSAASFELVARRSKARYVLGLSATVTRRDGHHPIILMQCGPVRFRVEHKAQAMQRGIEHCVLLRDTQFTPTAGVGETPPAIADIYRALAADQERTALIVGDVRAAVAEGRSPLVLTERRSHLDALAAYLGQTADVIVLRGGMKSAEREAAHAALRDASNQLRVVLSTGRYLGEGFDDPRLDTLFLAMPIAWKGTLAQYVGRLHREHHGKTDVLVYDYVDALVPVLARMSAKRQAGYRALGYRVRGSA